LETSSRDIWSQWLLKRRFGGYDVTPIADLAQKVEAVFLRLQPPETDPMTDFDERDLFALAEQAGFHEIHLELQAWAKPQKAGRASTAWRERTCGR
jgi:hypothetical protein